MALEPGYILNERYRIDRLLGAGGFGAVYQAWDMKLNGPCAIKESHHSTPDLQAQFEREASILFNLRHPGLPRVFDYFHIPDQGQYLVMDYIEGQSLQEKLHQAGGPLPEAQVLVWMDQVCDAVIYLHKQHPPVIHRDIKPANIKITPDGTAVLVDFGIAKVFVPDVRTMKGAQAVTPGFSPPEQYGQGGTDERSDVYALGATLYALLTGQVAPDSIEVATGLTPAPAPAREWNPALSLHVNAAIERAMQIEKSERFASVAEFKQALHSSAAPKATVVLPPSAPLSRPAQTVAASQGTPSRPPQSQQTWAVSQSPSQGVPSRPSQPQQTWAIPEPSQPTWQEQAPPAAPAKTNWKPIIALLGGAGVLFAVIVCIGAGLLARSFFPAESTATPTQQEAATATFTVQAATPTTAPPTAIPPTATQPLPTQPPEPTENPLGNPNASAPGEVYFETNFDTIDNWYDVTSSNLDESKYQMTVQNGKLYLEVQPEKKAVYAFYDLDLQNPDIMIRTWARKIQGANTNNISLVCRATDKGWYEFVITSGGLWEIWRYTRPSRWDKLANGGHRAINLKDNPNEITATCKGTRLILEANGVVIGQVSDSEFTQPGHAGVGIYSIYPNLGIEFDYFYATVP